MKSCCEHRNLPQPVLSGVAAAVWLASGFSACSVGTTRFIDGGLTLYSGFETGA
jgi:hypothetical protein